jgi:hypothetical protein
MDRWQTTDPDSAQPVWKIIEVGKSGNHALRVGGLNRDRPPGFGEVACERGPDGEVTGFTANSVRIRGLRFERVRD